MTHGKYATGWLRDWPDMRDWDAGDIFDKPQFDADGPLAADEIPDKTDWRMHCSPIENQGRLGSCTAQAVVGMAEYLERLTLGRHVDGSRLFVYKMARQLDGFTGDTGAFIRTAMKSLRLFGAPPERYWPYVIEKFDEDPTPFAFSLGQNWQALRYFRIDSIRRSRPDTLKLMKQLISCKLPIALGFRVFSWGNEEGEFPMPSFGQRPRGGHAVMACGYDDNRVIGKSKGAFLIRNSWGTGWGNKGYGWLPYDYILKYLSADFWTLVSKEVFMG